MYICNCKRVYVSVIFEVDPLFPHIRLDFSFLRIKCMYACMLLNLQSIISISNRDNGQRM